MGKSLEVMSEDTVLPVGRNWSIFAGGNRRPCSHAPSKSRKRRGKRPVSLSNSVEVFKKRERIALMMSMKNPGCEGGREKSYNWGYKFYYMCSRIDYSNIEAGFSHLRGVGEEIFDVDGLGGVMR